MFSIVTAPISIPTNSAQGVSFLHIQHLLSLYSLYFHPISQRANFFFFWILILLFITLSYPSQVLIWILISQNLHFHSKTKKQSKKNFPRVFFHWNFYKSIISQSKVMEDSLLLEFLPVNFLFPSLSVWASAFFPSPLFIFQFSSYHWVLELKPARVGQTKVFLSLLLT